MTKSKKLDAPKAINYIGIITMIIGALSVIAGIVLALPETFKYEIDPIDLFGITLKQDVLGGILIVLGIVFLVTGFGLRSLQPWAWFLYIITFLVMAVAIIAFFQEAMVPLIAMMVLSILLGDLLAENEFFINKASLMPSKKEE